MKNRAMVGALATVLVVGLVVAGLMAVGSPGTARKFKADQERRNRVSQLHYVLSAQVRQEGALPESLEVVEDEVLRQIGYGSDPREDPETGELFEYRKISDRSYEVCATFHASSNDARAREFGSYPGDRTHSAGRNCFERQVTDQDVESAFSGFPGFQGEFPGVAPPKLVPSETTKPTTEPALGDPSTRSSSPEAPLEPSPTPSSV